MLSMSIFQKDHISEDVLVNIFLHLGLKDLVNIAKVDKHVYNTVQKIMSQWINNYFPYVQNDDINNKNQTSFKSYINQIVPYDKITPIPTHLIIAALQNDRNKLDLLHGELRSLLYSLLMANQFYLHNENHQFNMNNLFPQDLEKNTILFFMIRTAVQKDQLKLLRYLIIKDFDISNTETAKLLQDAFKLAAIEGHLDVVKLLMKSHYISARIQHLTNNQCVFQHTAEKGHLDVLKYLYETTKITNDCMEYAITNAEKGNHKDIELFLKEKMQSVDIYKPKKGYLPLKQSTSSKKPVMLKVDKSENNERKSERCIVM